MKILKLLFIIPALLSISCNKYELPQTGTISGNLSNYDPGTPLVKTPVKGIKLWLLNADFKFDTVTFAGNREALVDSTFSDANGNYRFANIHFGNYFVSPLPGTAGYRFESFPSGNTTPLFITESAPDKSLSFISPLPGAVNAEFGITLNVSRNENKFPSYFKWNRQVWAVFLPYFEPTVASDSTEQKFILDSIPVMVNKSFEYGFFGFFFTRSNNFLLDFYNSADIKVDSYWITQDLGNTPSRSVWEIDLKGHSIKRTSP